MPRGKKNRGGRKDANAAEQPEERVKAEVPEETVPEKDTVPQPTNEDFKKRLNSDVLETKSDTQVSDSKPPSSTEQSVTSLLTTPAPTVEENKPEAAQNGGIDFLKIPQVDDPEIDKSTSEAEGKKKKKRRRKGSKSKQGSEREIEIPEQPKVETSPDKKLDLMAASTEFLPPAAHESALTATENQEIHVHVQGDPKASEKVIELIEKMDKDFHDISAINIETDVEKPVHQTANLEAKTVDAKAETADLEADKRPVTEILEEFGLGNEKGLETLDQINQEIGQSSEDLLNRNFSSNLPGFNKSENKKEEDYEGDESVGRILKDEFLTLQEIPEKSKGKEIEVIPELEEEYNPKESAISERNVRVPEQPAEGKKEEQPVEVRIEEQPAEVKKEEPVPDTHSLVPLTHESQDDHKNMTKSVDSVINITFKHVPDDSLSAERPSTHLDTSLPSRQPEDHAKELLKMSHVHLATSIPLSSSVPDRPLTESVDKSGSVLIDPLTIKGNHSTLTELIPLEKNSPNTPLFPDHQKDTLSSAMIISTANDMKIKGDEMFEIGKFEAAVHQYNETLRFLGSRLGHLETGSHEAIIAGRIHANIASCKAKAGDLDEVLFHLSQAVKHDHSNIKAVCQEARVLKSVNRGDEALRLMKETLAVAKAHPDKDIKSTYLALYNDLLQESYKAETEKRIASSKPEPKPALAAEKLERHMLDSGAPYHEDKATADTSTIKRLALCVVAGAAAGGAFLASARNQAAALSFGGTAVGVYAAQSDRSLLTRLASISAVVALNIVLYKKL